MRLRKPQLWIAGMSAVLVLSLALVDLGRTSPGALALVHGRDPNLLGRSGCSECHGGWGQSMKAACLDCHEGIQEDIDSASGLHGVLERARDKSCAVCHSEHHGTDFAVVNLQSFIQAGVERPGRFDHGRIGFAMDGAHLELACSDCHEQAFEPLLPPETQRFRGLDADCASCHEDSHEGEMVVACAKCHGQESFQTDGLASLGHEFFVPLIGGHEALDCAECHEPTDESALDFIGRHGRPSEHRECAACHDSPHQTDFLAGTARLAGKSSEASCGVCHQAAHTSFRDERMQLTRSQHKLSGFALDAPHDRAACGDCHDPAAKSFEARFPGRSADACASCHDDPHAGQFDDGPHAALGCLACHDRQGFGPHTFTAEDHRETALPLTGAHLDAGCNDCHEVAREGDARVFHGTPSHCSACHADAHEGFFFERAATLDELPSPECGACHATSAWGGVEPAQFDHGFWTGFAVQGAHAQGTCEDCHLQRSEPGILGRTFGRVEERFSEYEGCSSCHQDPHEGVFDSPGFPQLVDGRSDCARCHSATSFRAVDEDFDHGTWTGFALDAVHAAIGCTACHEPLRRPDVVGRTWGRAAGRECADCHSDPHAGQFEIRGGSDCSRCHKSGRRWEDLAFHHNWHSRFLLDEAHEKLACSACHKPFSADTGQEIVRYRPLGMECIDCHGVNEDQILRRPRRGGR